MDNGLYIHEWLVGENKMGKKDKGKWESGEETIWKKYNQREKRSYNRERDMKLRFLRISLTYSTKKKSNFFY